MSSYEIDNKYETFMEFIGACRMGDKERVENIIKNHARMHFDESVLIRELYKRPYFTTGLNEAYKHGHVEIVTFISEIIASRKKTLK
jgi:hypothetical protein